MASRPPTLEQLRERLAVFRAALQQCDYIDDWQAYRRCRDMNQQQISRLEAAIRAREGRKAS